MPPVPRLKPYLALAVATVGGAGYFPRSPGTAGALVGLPVAWAVHRVGGLPALWLAAALVTVAGVVAAEHACRFFGKPDDQRVVVDELAGQLLTFALVPPLGLAPLGCGLLLFRLLDIFKPWPIRWLDRNVHGGLGVMLDDVAAGAAAALILFGLNHVGVLEALEKAASSLPIAR